MIRYEILRKKDRLQRYVIDRSGAEDKIVQVVYSDAAAEKWIEEKTKLRKEK